MKTLIDANLTPIIAPITHNKEGVLLNTYGERYTVRANTSFKLADNFTIGENLSYSLTDGQTANTANAYTGAILAAVFYPPNATIYREDGSGQFGGVPEKYIGSYGDVINPVAYLKRLDNRNPVSTILINPYAEWEIVPGLKVKSNWGYTRIQDNATDFSTKITEPGKIFDFNRLTKKSATTTDLLSEQTVSYEKSFGKHNLKALAGYTYQETKRDFYTVEGTGFDSEDPSQRYLLNAKLIQQTGAGLSDEIISSYVGRINYDFNQKYLISGIVRRDGTSKLLSENRWKVYPSVSAGWLISEEGFMKGISSTVSNLKLRASWGQLGNEAALGYYSANTLIKTGNSLGNGYVQGVGSNPWPGSIATALENRNLQWETTDSKNVGIDFTLKNGKISGSMNYYHNVTDNLLITKRLAPSAGIDNPILNVGKISNSGFELEVNYRDQVEEFKYNVGFNLTTLKNKVESLANEGQTIYGEGLKFGEEHFPTQARVGSPISGFYLYKTDGIFQTVEEVKAHNKNGVLLQPNAQPGDIRFKDLNGDGSIDENDKAYAGTGLPKLEANLSLGASYKGFDFSALIGSGWGNKLYNGNRYFYESMSAGTNMLASTLNSWTPENRSNMPRAVLQDPNGNSRESDRFLESGNFVRMRQIQLGYTIPSKMLGKAKIDKLRFYVSVENLFTITDYSGIDPEFSRASVLDTGVDRFVYPFTRSFVSGVQYIF